MQQLDFSPLAVSVQALGTLLLALMLAQLGRISARRYARRWAAAWGLFFLALVCVRLYIYTDEPLTWAAYLLFEWGFLALLWSGCRNFVKLPDIANHLLAYGVAAAALLAALMTRFAPTFNSLFIGQAAIVAAGAIACIITLYRITPDRRDYGWRTLRLALILMALVYGSYIPLFAVHEYVRYLPILRASSLADLMVSIGLGFGMILVTAEDANTELRETLSALAQVRRRLEKKLNTDPLTNALNRHAFHSMQRGDDVSADQLAGVVLMIDIDSLKAINDKAGHAAGDAVIRAAANVIRAIIRADDLLFRWGGDEFVAVIPNLNLEIVAARLRALNAGGVARLPDGRELPFGLSWGGAEFGPNRALDDAMRDADGRMYQNRESSRAAGGTPVTC